MSLDTPIMHPDPNQSTEDTQIPMIDQEEGKSSITKFSANLMKSITGSTSLIFPYAMWQMGLLTGVILTTVVVYVYCSCAYRLFQVRKEYEKEERDDSDPIYQLDNDYTILCYHYFGKIGYWLILVSTLITLWGSDMGTLVLMTDFLVALPIFNNIGSTKYIQRLLPTIIIFISCWLTCILKNPSLLAGISSFGLIALITAFIVLLIYGGVHWGLSWDSSVLYPQSMTGILSNIGVIINAFGFLLVLFPLYNNLRTKEKPKAMSNINGSLTILGLIYTITGIILFLMFRQDPGHVKEAILLNLPNNSFAYYAVSLTMVLTLLGSFPLLLLPCFEILESHIENKKINRFFVTDSKRFWSRTLQVVIITILAYFLPKFNDINAIIGSFTGVVVSQLLPSLLHLKVIGTKKGVWRVIEDWIILIVFFFVMIICTYSSVMSLINSL